MSTKNTRKTLIGRTTSTTLAAATKLDKIPSDYNRKRPSTIERGIEPNKVIKRRFDEGSKPLFEREDINVNQEQAEDHQQNDALSCKTLHGRPRRRNSPDSSSFDQQPRTTDLNAPASTSRTKNLYQTSIKRRTPDKIPYFLDEKREKERLIRTYGSTSAATYKRDQDQSKIHKSKTKRRQSSRSPPPSSTTNYTHSKSSHQKHLTTKSDAPKRRTYHQSTRHRSQDRERHDSSSEERSRRHHSSRHHHSRSRSHSRTRSRSRERCRRRDQYHRRDRYGHAKSVSRPATQIITIPVPVDSYGFTTWPHPPAPWATTPGAARYGAPYQFPSMMPPHPFASPVMLRPLRPPPHRMCPYNGPIFGPRFPPCQLRGNFRPRHY